MRRTEPPCMSCGYRKDAPAPARCMDKTSHDTYAPVSPHSPTLDPMLSRRLSGCEIVIRFGSKDELARAVGTLIGCHGHYFIVLNDDEPDLACSERALKCLREHGSLPRP